MPRARGLAFRDPRTITFYRQKPRQLDRLLLANSLRATTSRLPGPALEKVLRDSQNAQARHVNRRRLYSRSSQILSPNHGCIVGVKDNFVTQDLPTTCASHILEGFSAQDATVIKLLKRSGVAIVAKTNMDEFGMGSHSTHSAYGAVRRGSGPEALSAGGSSGGSAITVATGLVDTALGSDTGGSVRLPAAYNGIIGFKPSYGMISRHGLIPYANSLDTVGILGKSCLDVGLLFGTLNRFDPKDPTSLSASTRQRINEVRRLRRSRDSVFSFVSHQPHSAHERTQRSKTYKRFSRTAFKPNLRRIGVPVEYNIAEMHPDVRRAWTRTLSNLQYLGHDIIPISLPSTQQALSAYYVLAPAEASSNLAKYDGVRYGKNRANDSVDDAEGVLYSKYRGEFFGEEVQRRILLGSFTLSAGAIDNYFMQAQRVRRIVRSDFDLVFRMANPLQPNAQTKPEGVDYIICPTAPTPPPTLAEVETGAPLDSYINDVFTVPASLAGLPAISVPALQDSSKAGDIEHAIGMQVIGQFGDDLGVINFARRWLEEQPESSGSSKKSVRRARFR